MKERVKIAAAAAAAAADDSQLHVFILMHHQLE